MDVAEGKSYSYKFTNVPDDEEIGDPNIPIGWEKIDDPGIPGGTGKLPDTGSLLNTWMLLIMGIFLIMTGMFLNKGIKIRS